MGLSGGHDGSAFSKYLGGPEINADMTLSPLAQTWVVLVRPQYPENAGLCARAAKAFGAAGIRLVAPSFEWDPNGAAAKTASGAEDYLENAVCHDRLLDAVADMRVTAGFSRRTHRFPRPSPDLDEWCGEWARTGGKTALVFGPENFGLSNEDKHICHRLVHIPCSGANLSLNLGQAAATVLYAHFGAGLKYGESEEAQAPAAEDESVTEMDVRRLLELFASGDGEGGFLVNERRRETLRMLIQRMKLNRVEYAVIAGALRDLGRK